MNATRLGGVLAFSLMALLACSSTSNKAADPCALLTVQDISREVGLDVTDGARTKSDAVHSTGCTYHVDVPNRTTDADVQIWTGESDRMYNALKQQGAAVVTGSRYSTLSVAVDRLPETDVAVSRRDGDYIVVYAYGHSGAAARIADLAAANLP